MGRLTNATPRFSFRLGALLLGLFPTNIVTAVAVGAYLGSNDLALTDAWTFVSVTLLLLASPALVVLAFGSRADVLLPRLRNWMVENAWLVNEVVLAFFVGILVRSLGG
jgi:hypothetical protein